MNYIMTVINPDALKKLSDTVEPQPRGLPIGSVDIRNGIEIPRFK